MSDKQNLEILNSIYKNSKMASDSICQVLEQCDDNNLKKYIAKQQKQYEEDYHKTGRRIREIGGTAENPPAMASFMASAGVDMKTMFDKSRQNIAKLMYNGTNMGIVDITRVLNRASDADGAVIEEAKALLKREQNYADGLKKYL